MEHLAYNEMSCVRDEDILNNIFDPIVFLGSKTLKDNLPDTLKGTLCAYVELIN